MIAGVFAGGSKCIGSAQKRDPPMPPEGFEKCTPVGCYPVDSSKEIAIPAML
jgi:hypothetical protein